MFVRNASIVGMLVVAFVVAGVPVTPSLPTPGVNCQAAAAPLPPEVRFIPEPELTNDFISFFEALDCLDALEAAHPDRIAVRVVAESYGIMNHATQERESHPIYIVEVTNEKSDVPFEDKLKVLFMLSIHGNEKGGREGGFRVIEDFVRNIGSAQQPATGHAGKTLYDLMDQVVLLFLFPNADGWAWDEPQYAQPADCGYPGFYKRYNGHCTDLNRQFPTIGWQFINEGAGRLPLAEPEPRGYSPALVNYTNIAYAADIHGMLNPADGNLVLPDPTAPDPLEPFGETYGHFILGLISAGRVDPQEMLRGTRLAEILDDRLNTDPTFAAWSSLPSTSVWGGEFYSWSTVWDTIGYTDSGISGDFFLQDTGLNAPGMNFEMAYNHITFDSAYPGVAQLMNVYHVQTVRVIVRTYLEAAVTDVRTSIETHGRTTGYLYNPKVITDKDDEAPLDGWAADNAHDDLWDIDHIDFEAAPNDYFRDLQPFVKDGDQPGVLEEVQASQLTAERLARFDNFVVAGSAAEQVTEHHHDMLKAFVEGGGNLVLTDQALQLLQPLAGLEARTVSKYAGMTILEDRAHPFAAHSVKLSRQTYEPVPLGYSLSADNSPVWYVPRDAFTSLGGEVVGSVPMQGHTSPGGGIALGRVPLGTGTVSFLGALLPDPTEAYYHPYGLDSYATTYFGNLLLYNMLGGEQVFSAPPLALGDVGKQRPLGGDGDGDGAPATDNGGGAPGFGWLVLAAAATALLVVVRRRRA